MENNGNGNGRQRIRFDNRISLPAIIQIAVLLFGIVGGIVVLQAKVESATAAITTHAGDPLIHEDADKKIERINRQIDRSLTPIRNELNRMNRALERIEERQTGKD